MPGIDAPLSITDLYTSKLPWRFSTELFKTRGARAVRNPGVILPAGQRTSLLRTRYAENTIDRIIGFYFNVQAPLPTGAMFITFMDLLSKWRQDVAVGNHFGCYMSNVETNTDQCDIVAIPSIQVTANFTFYNFEVSNSHPGHY